MNGVLELIDWHGPVLVVSEGWPSWSFALRNLGCSDIATLARFRQPRLREEFKSTTLGSTYVNSYNDLVFLPRLVKNIDNYLLLGHLQDHW